MNWYPKNLYVDIREEETDSTFIMIKKKQIDNMRIRKNNGKYIRVFDGNKWFSSSSSDNTPIQEKVDHLAHLAITNPSILFHPRIKAIKPIQESKLVFQDKKLSCFSIEDKLTILHQFDLILSQESLLTDWTLIYNDFYTLKHFESSQGSRIEYDKQMAGIGILLQMEHKGRFFQEAFMKGALYLDNLDNLHDEFIILLEKAKHSLIEGKHVQPGSYSVILSPFAAGVFAHESFGHKSEADFMTMTNSPDMAKEWPIGKQVGSEQLSIVDDGSILAGGYIPFDDEGTPAHTTWLIKNGILSGRLRSIETALEMGEQPTGNARAINYEFEPVVRMTNTFIEPGTLSKNALFESVDYGYFIDTIKHGSGMSRFTIAPSISYEIVHGKITNPVEIAVISGHVMDTLHKITGLSDKKEISTFPVGGCGKFEQTGLPVGLGGPYVRIDSMEIQ